MENQQKEYRDISELRLWDKNPKSITKEDFKRLKRQLQRLGVYKPLIITEDGLVLGGNMRLRAYKELGYTTIWVSVVDAPTDAKKMEYALSDNDLVGVYEEADLADFLMQNDEEIPLEDYKINIGSLSLDKLLKSVGPGDESAIEEDNSEEKGKEITCPECGAVFYE